MQHVAFLEPLLDPGVEVQAIARVDRIGQQRDTHVHRFVVSDTIEDSVHKICQTRAAAMDLSAASVKRRSKGERGTLTLLDVARLLRAGGRDRRLGEGEKGGETAMGTAVPLEESLPNGPAGSTAMLSPRQRAAAAALARAGQGRGSE